jgi:hypothetical protein
MVQSGIQPTTLRHVAQFYRDVLFVNNGLLNNSPLHHHFTMYIYIYVYTERRPSVESLMNYVARVRLAVGQPWYEVWRCCPNFTYRNHAQLKDSLFDMS